MREALLSFGVVICVIVVHPSCGRAQAPEDDWREIRPSATATPKTNAGAQDSDSPSPQPTLATGRIDGLRAGGSPEIELRLRPQPNGFLHGEMIIHKSAYGQSPIEGFVRGNHLQFQLSYGNETFYFEGQRRADQMGGTYESTPSGERGTWSAQAD